MSVGSQESQSQQSVWDPQAQALQSLYTQAQDFFGGPNANMQNAATAGVGAIPALQGMATGAQGAYSDILGGTNPLLTQATSALGGAIPGITGLADTGAAAYENLLTGPNAYQSFAGGMVDPAQQAITGALTATGVNPALDAALQAGFQRAGQSFREEVLPGFGREAGALGQRDSSRQGIAEGLAMGKLGQSFAEQAANAYASDFGRQEAQRMQAAQLASQNIGGAQAQGASQQLGALGMAPALANLGLAPSQAYADLYGLQAGNQLNALGQTANVANLTTSPMSIYQNLYGMEAQPYMNLAQIIGGPQTLSSSSSSGWSVGAPVPSASKGP